MRNFFLFLWKYQFFILFIILEIISFTFLLNSYSYHKSLTFNTVSDISGNIFSSYSNITSYYDLADENQKLRDENAHLRNQLESSIFQTDTCIVYSDSLFAYIPAIVISNSVNKGGNYIMINKGKKHGVKKEMGIISSTGLAGIVIGVSENYSLAMSMLHPNSRISGRLKKSGQLVNVIWQGFDYTMGYVIDIPSYITLEEGDTLVTSGNSLIFPEGIMIGTIVGQQKKSGQELGEAYLKFSTDFNSLSTVYIIDNLKRDEQLELQTLTEDE